MLPRTRGPLSAVRRFILATSICTTSIAHGVVPSSLVNVCVRLRSASNRNHQRGPLRYVSAAQGQPKPIPHALTAAVRALEEQVQRGELDFLTYTYDYLRRIVLDAERRGLPLADADSSILPNDVITRARSLLATSPQKIHAALHLEIYNDLLPVLRVHAEAVHPLEFTAQIFQEHIDTGSLGSLSDIYDHMQYLASAVPDPRKIFVGEPAGWRASSWMHRLMGGSATDLLPRILPDLPRLFGLQPTLAHHHLVIKGFTSRNMPDQGWSWLRKMEQYGEHLGPSAVWLKPSVEQYDLLLKYFADRGDVFTVRILLSKMCSHVTPSKLSHHLLLAAILAKSLPGPGYRVLVEAAVEQMEGEGHGVHLKMLGGVMGRGPVKACVPEDIFDVLRASQARSIARIRSNKFNPKEQEPKEHEKKNSQHKGGDRSMKLGSAKDDGGVSESVTCEPGTGVGETVPVSVASTEGGSTRVPFHGKGEDTDPVPPTSSPNTVNDEKNSMVDIEYGLGAIYRGEHLIDHAGHNSPPASTVGSRAQNDVDVEMVSADILEAFSAEIPPNVSLSESLRQSTNEQARKTAQMIHPHPPPHQLHRANRTEDQGLDGTHPDRAPIWHDTHFMDRLSSNFEASGASRPSEPSGNDAKPSASNGLEGRVRHKLGRLLTKSLQAGDLRQASKVYAELTTIAGPDTEYSLSMIKALCKGHLLNPPPRPHILQALKIYRSLAKVRTQTGPGEGSSESTNDNSPGQAKNGAHIHTYLFQALSAPALGNSSFRDLGKEVYEEYANFAMELLADIQARGFTADSRTLVSIILLRFRAAKTHQEAFGHYVSLSEGQLRPENTSSPNPSDKDAKNSGATLDIAGYKAILDAFARLSFPDDPVAPAHLWFAIADDFRTRGYAITVEDYTKYLGKIADTQIPHLLAQQASTGVALPNGGERGIRAMYSCVQHIHKRLVLDAHISPDTPLLNALMNAYQRLGAFDDALRVFNTIWLSGMMDHVSPIIIFDACGHAGRQNVAYMIWCMLVAKGWRFNKRTLDTWVECLCRANIEAACRFVCVYMGRENTGYLSDGDTRPDVQTCLILLKLSWLQSQNNVVKERLKAHLPHIWEVLATRYQ